MPLYDFRCTSGHNFERHVKLSDFEAVQFCACTAPATRVIRPVRFSVEAVEYDCPITGKAITSKLQHEDNLARHDCRILEAGETEQSKKAAAAKEVEFERKLDETVEKEFEAMPSAKKEALANELTAGVSLEYTRSAQ